MQEPASCPPILMLPVELWEESLIPRLISFQLAFDALLPLSMTCKALRAALEPHIFLRIVLGLPGTIGGVSTPMCSSSSPVSNACRHLRDCWEGLSSSPIRFHTKALYITPSPGDSVAVDPLLERAYDRQRTSWYSMAMDLCIPLLPRLIHLRFLTFHEMKVTDDVVETIISLATLESLALISGEICLGRPLIRARFPQLRVVNITKPSGDNFLDLVEVVLRSPISDLCLTIDKCCALIDVLSRDGPFLTVTDLSLTVVDLLDPIGTAAHHFPNIKRMAGSSYPALDCTEWFPLTPDALPYLVDFSGSGIYDARAVADTCLLERVGFYRTDLDESLPQIGSLLSSHRGAVQGTLRTMDMSFGTCNATSLAQLLETVCKSAKRLKHLTLSLRASFHEALNGWLQVFEAEHLPLLLSTLSITIYGRSSQDKIEKHELLDFLRRMSDHKALERINLQCDTQSTDFSLFYDREVYGPLSPERCEEQCKMTIVHGHGSAFA